VDSLTALAALAVAVGALVQGITGIGFSLVSAPFLIALVGVHDGVRVSLVLGSVLNIALLGAEHRHVRAGDAALLFVPAAIVTPFVAIAIKHAPSGPLAVAGGLLTIAAAAAVARGRFRGLRGRSGAVVAGTISGAMNVTAAIGGPAAAIYALNTGWPPEATRPTLQVYFLGLNLVAAGVLGVLLPSALLFVAMATGLAAGFILRGRVSSESARRATLLLAVAGGVAAIIRGVA
jgi:uncharacterized membrane protein YfcA